ncbi:MAG TPA: HAMP domain-containing sensor histidine kinase [Thermoleophilaceae bacterium]|jgi:signal transduction histidine kinase
MRIARSFRARVALAAVAAAAIVVLAAGGVLFATAGRDERRDLDRQLENETRALAGPRALGGPGAPGPPGVAPGPGADEIIGSGRVVRVTRAGQTLRELGDLPKGSRLPDPTEPGFRTVDLAGQSWRVYTAPGPPGFDVAVQIAASLEPIESRARSRRRATVLLGLAALALSGGLGWAFGGIALRPLARLRGAAAGVGSDEDLSARVPRGDGPEEIDALADSLNEMLARLEGSSGETRRALDASRRFAADAGHELRTPLMSLRANVDSLSRNPDLAPDQRARMLEDVRSELARLTGVLDALQELARGDARVTEGFAGIDLAELADAAVDSLRTRRPRLEVELEAPDGGVALTGSGTGLRLVLDNLLENAARHGGSHVRVAIEQVNGGGRVVVDDDGPGIPEDEREHVFERFSRLGANGGSGLGLAIVAQQARLHGGEAHAEDSPLGGARFVVDLPGLPA